MSNYGPKLPNKYQGTNKSLLFYVTRKRAPTTADYKQPETGANYSLGTVWQVGKDPTTGTEGDIWILAKIASNLATWYKVEGASSEVATVEGNTGGIVGSSPTNNIFIYGLGETTTNGIPASYELDILSPRTSAFVVDPTQYYGTHQTIQTAIDDASAGDTIVIRPGTYTENLTVDKNLAIVAFNGQGRGIGSDNINIIGLITVSANTTSVISGILSTSNGSGNLDATASNANVSLINCRTSTISGDVCFKGANNIYVNNCYSSGAGTAKLFEMTGTIWFNSSWSESFTTASTGSSGSIILRNTRMQSPITTSGTGLIQSLFSSHTGTVTIGGSSSSYIDQCYFATGANACISISSAVTVTNTTLNSSATNVITGAGTLSYAGLNFSGSSSAINVTTQNLLSIGPNATYSGTGSLKIPTGTTAQRPTSPVAGMIRGNSTLTRPEYYDGSSWIPQVGVKTAWTPVLSFGGGSTGITYSAQTASYVRIGDSVLFTMFIQLTSKGSSTGTMKISGLPASALLNTPCSVRTAFLTFANQLVGRALGDGLYLDNMSSGGSLSTLSDTAFANNTAIQISGTYII